MDEEEDVSSYWITLRKDRKKDRVTYGRGRRRKQLLDNLKERCGDGWTRKKT